jgi:hypothetical protein
MPADDILPAILERVTSLDDREDEHWQAASERLRQLGLALNKIRTEGHMHGEALAAMDGLVEAVADIDARLRILAGRKMADAEKTYDPAPNVGWHKLDGEERDKAVARLRSWADRVFVPGYGYLAEHLPPCWDQHPLCWYVLDWLSELWSVLYLTEERSAGSLAGQAEFTTRLLPAAVDQMGADAKSCHHRAVRSA